MSLALVPKPQKQRRVRKAKQAATGPERAIIVTRLSTEEKDEGEESSHATQEASCRKWAEANGVEIVAVLQDDDESADRLNRPGLQTALRRIEAGEANILLVLKVDRLARGQEIQGTILYDLRKANARLVSATENFDNTPVGKFILSALAFAAEVELLSIRERVNRDQIARYWEKKRPKVGRNPLYGYDRVREPVDGSYYVINPEQAPIVRRIFTEAAAGQGQQKIAAGLTRDRVPTASWQQGKPLRPWTTSVVNAILKRDAYWTGEHTMWLTQTERESDGEKWAVSRPPEERYTVPVPTIIEAGLGECSRAAAARNTFKTARSDREPEEGLLRFGYARCGVCGRPLSLSAPKGRAARYTCTQPHPAGSASKPSIAMSALDEPVWEWVSSVLDDPDSGLRSLIEPDRDAASEQHAIKLTQLEAHLTASREKLTRLIEGFATEGNRIKRDAIEAHIDKVSTEIEAAEAERAELLSPARQFQDWLTIRYAVITGAPEAIWLLAAQAREAMAAVTTTTPFADWDGKIAHSKNMIDQLRDAWNSGQLRDAWNSGGLRRWPEPDLMSYAGKRAALSRFGVDVVVYPESAPRPRWAATIIIDGGTILRQTDRVVESGVKGYLSASTRSTGRSTPAGRRCSGPSGASWRRTPSSWSSSSLPAPPSPCWPCGATAWRSEPATPAPRDRSSRSRGSSVCPGFVVYRPRRLAPPPPRGSRRRLGDHGAGHE